MSRHRNPEACDREGQSRRSLKNANDLRVADVVKRARDRLESSSYPSLRTIRCYFHEGVLTVRGRVPSYHVRQVAWKLVGELAGVEEFVDRLEVIEPH